MSDVVEKNLEETDVNEIKKFRKVSDEIIMEIGRMEIRKKVLIDQIAQIQIKMNELEKYLMKKYDVKEEEQWIIDLDNMKITKKVN